MVPLMARRPDAGDHIHPHRVWNYVKFGGEFASEEHDHILQCEQCLHLFILSFKSDTFGALLKQLGYDDRDELRTA
jgi:hypothetical protein